MRREELNEIYYLKKERQRIQDCIDMATAAAEHCTSNMSSAPAHSSASSKQQIYIEQKEKYIDELSECNLNIDNKIIEVERFINGIPEPLVRLIIHYRSACCLSWKEVAHKIGGRATEESCRQIYSRFKASLPE